MSRSPKLLLALTLGLCLLFGANIIVRAQDNSGAHFEQAPCPFQNTGQYPIDCGWLVVPENHADPTGKHIRLAVATIHSLNPHKAPDPVVYVVGGPGGAFVSTAPLVIYQFGLAALLTERDVVLLDQRGMGLSQPAIHCRTFKSFADFSAQTSADYPPANYVDVLAGCRRAWDEAGINPAFYTAQQNAADFADLRTAMGYSTINLYGTSFGTRIILMILRDHPEGIRSAVLDSTLPPQINPLENTASNFDRAFTVLEQSCANDIICRTAYPDIRGTYLRTIQRLTDQPGSISVPGFTMTVSAKSLEGAVSQGLINSVELETLPGFIYAVADGDYTHFIDGVEAKLNASPDQMPDLGPFIAMACPEHLTTSPEQVSAALAAYPEAFRSADPFSGMSGYRICQMAGISAPAAPAPAVSDVSTLFLAGHYDPLTPPDWARLAAKTLPHSTIVEFSHMGHVVSSDKCAQTIMIQFVQNPSAWVDSSCLASEPSSAFAPTLAATRLPLTAGSVVLSVVALFGVVGGSLIAIKNYPKIAFRETFNKLGRTALIVGALAVIVAIVANQIGLLDNHVNALQMAIPVVMAIQTAMIFSPDDEPGLEVLLALPRPISWLVLERFAVLFLVQIGVALAGAVVIFALDPAQNIAVLLFGWIASALFLSGISLYITLRTRSSALGIVLSLFLWIIFGLFSSLFLPGKGFPFPFNAIQPFMWVLNIHASTHDISLMDYWLNRLFLTSAGIGLIMLAVRQVRDPEQLLQGQGRKKRLTALATTTLAASEAVLPDVVAIAIRTIPQVLSIAIYEYKMQWQRSGFKVLTLAASLGTGILLLILGNSLGQLIPSMPPLATLPAEQAQLIKGFVPVMLGSGFLIVVMTIVLPLLVADTIPIERQQRVHELMSTLPVSKSNYLIGKVLGIWLAAVVSLVISAILIAVIWFVLSGSFDVRALVDLTFAGILPLLLLSSGFSVLIGATQPTRRRALAAVFIAFLVISGISFLIPNNGFLPDQWGGLNFFLNQAINGLVKLPPVPPVSITASPLWLSNIAWGAVELVIVGVAVWFWQKDRQL